MGLEDERALAIDKIKVQFENRNQNKAKAVYTHVTCATDTGMIQTVFAIVKDVVINTHLKESGF